MPAPLHHSPQVVEPKKAIVDEDVKTAEAAAAAANAIKTECEAALSEAIPILNSAIAALDTIKPADIKLVQVCGRLCTLVFLGILCPDYKLFSNNLIIPFQQPFQQLYYMPSVHGQKL